MSKTIIRMSNTGKCPRALSAQLLGYESAPAPAWLETAANEGNLHEAWIVKQLNNEGYNVYDQQLEIKLEFPTFILLGHIDGKVNKQDDGKKLLEIKTMSQFEFNRWMKGGFDEFPNYLDQLTCYMEATGLDEALYIVKNRSSGYISKQIFNKIPSGAAMNSIISKLDSIICSVQQYKLCEAEFDASSIRCRRCSYRDIICLKSKEDMTIQDERILADATRKWRRGTALIDEGKPLVAEAKKILEEHTIASGIQKWRFDDLAITQVHTREYTRPEALVKANEYIKINDMR